MTDASFAKIDYSVRPAKYAERKMLVELFRNVGPFEPPNQYVYVGLGSVWFSDFTLLHKHVGVREMISIERAASAKERVEANKPYRCITMEYKSSSDVLPNLDWKKRHFLWLDFDDQLTTSMLLDARTVASHGRSGTVLAVSVQCQRAKEMTEAQADPQITGIDRFISRFGRERVAQDVQEDDLTGWRFGSLSRAMIAAEIEDELARRNVTLPVEKQLKFKTICLFEYADGAKMTTLVGMLVANEDAELFKKCCFSELDFLPASGKIVRIDVPLLTIREMRHSNGNFRRLRKISGIWVPFQQLRRGFLQHIIGTFQILL